MLLDLLHVEVSRDDDRDGRAVPRLEPAHGGAHADGAVPLRRDVFVLVVACFEVRGAHAYSPIQRTELTVPTALVPRAVHAPEPAVLVTLEPQQHPRERDAAPG